MKKLADHDKTGGKVASGSAKLSPVAVNLLRERDQGLPIWIRAPKRGPEFYSGFTRPKLYELATNGRIRTCSIRESGKIRGTRLFNLKSILDFIDSQCA